tara:strand:- start:640 stop:828 length:189 start_codon:yes stop_codon:yes gene_type:complete
MMMMKFSSLNIFKLIVANAMLIGATVNATSLWSLNATDINGDIVDFQQYSGSVALVINVATY